eukprot:m.35092 g.35092  ORF g.35092 m.35092 type:complete len:653 (+) comp9988_c0_seq1:71-2029(+)
MEEEIVVRLQATLSHDEDIRVPAEKELKQAQSTPGFAASLLNVIGNPALNDTDRLSGSVYFKNLIARHWNNHEGLSNVYVIPDEERPGLRGVVINTTMSAPMSVRKLLCVALSTMVDKHFPEGWEGVDDTFIAALSSGDINLITGALMAFYSFTKKFRSRKREVRAPYWQLLEVLNPHIQATLHLCMQEGNVYNEDYLVALRFILKIYFNSCLLTMPPVYATEEACDFWNESLIAIVNLPRPEVPEEDVEYDDIPQLPFFKVQKWATRTMESFFERYGLPQQCEEDLQAYAHNYMEKWATPSLQAMTQLLAQSMNTRESARVVRNSIEFMSHAVDSSLTFKIMKDYLDPLITDVLFVLLCHSDLDDQLWTEDPYEYIRRKHGMEQAYSDPSVAAGNLIANIADKRTKYIMPYIEMYMSGVQDSSKDVKYKDGCLNFLSTLSETILEKKKVKKMMEEFVMTTVKPFIEDAEFPFLQRSACAFINRFSDLGFSEPSNVEHILGSVVNCLLQSNEDPVCVEASITMYKLLENQQQVRPLIVSEELLGGIVEKLLQLLRETENDDLTDVLARLIDLYKEDMAPFAVALAEMLRDAFVKLKDYDPDSEQDQHKVMAAQGTIESIKNLAEIFQEDMTEERIQFEECQSGRSWDYPHTS